MSTKQLTIPAMAAVLLLASCGGGTTEKEQPKVEVTVDDMAVSDDNDFILPQPITLANAFKNAGLTYTPGKTNPASNKGNYVKKIDQLLNLGVYSTDLAYCAINNKTQEAREYLSAIQTIGTKVGMESVFSDKSLIEKFDKNLGNTDVIEELIYEMQDKSDTYLQDNDLKYLAAIEFAGAWAEGMYLGVDDSRKKQSDLSIALVEQISLLRNIIKGLESHPTKDERLQEVISAFNEVLDTYEGFASVKKVATNKNFTAPTLTDAEFETLATKIVSLRNGIVSPAKK